MSLYDFYMYLKYIEYSAENLEFYIWCVLVPLLVFVFVIEITSVTNTETGSRTTKLRTPRG